MFHDSNTIWLEEVLEKFLNLRIKFLFNSLIVVEVTWRNDGMHGAHSKTTLLKLHRVFRDVAKVVNWNAVTFIELNVGSWKVTTWIVL